MKTSCITHPANEQLIIIRKWQFEFCTDKNGRQDKVAAALLSFFEYWHNIKQQIRTKNAQSNKMKKTYGDNAIEDETLWQFHTYEELESGIMGIGSETKIREAVKLLESKLVIKVSKNPNPRYKFDNTNFYIFYPDMVNNWLFGSYVHPSKLRSVCLENNGRALENNGRALENEGTIPKITNRDYKQRIKNIKKDFKEPKSIKKPEKQLIDFFEKEIWTIYPKRYGSNPKAAALRRYLSLIKQKEKKEIILNGTINYSIYCKDKEITNTEFVMTASKFYGKDKHFLDFQIKKKRRHWADDLNNDENKDMKRIKA